MLDESFTKIEPIKRSNSMFLHPSPDIDIKVIKQIGDYSLGTELGSGAFGKVVLGKHILTNELVAIKILDKMILSHTPDDYQSVKQEINILKSVKHKHIVQLYEVLQTSRHIFIIMEYCEGKDLLDYILTKSKLSEEESLKYFQQLINALFYLHSQNIAHRDIKIDNMLLDRNRDLKLVDFGLSTKYPDDNLLDQPCGTVVYAAPEVLQGREYHGMLADVWSSGIVLYGMLSGYLPFGEQDDEINRQNIIMGKIRFPSFFSDCVKDLLMHMLDLDPMTRFTLQEVRSHPWFNLLDYKLIPGIIIGYNVIPVDEKILNLCVTYNYDKEKVRESVVNNKYNAESALYYLLIKKLMKKGFQSVSDFCSDDFIRFVLDDNNLIDSKFDEKNNQIQDSEIKYNININANNNCSAPPDGKLRYNENKNKNENNNLITPKKGENEENINKKINFDETPKGALSYILNTSSFKETNNEIFNLKSSNSIDNRNTKGDDESKKTNKNTSSDSKARNAIYQPININHFEIIDERKDESSNKKIISTEFLVDNLPINNIFINENENENEKNLVDTYNDYKMINVQNQDNNDYENNFIKKDIFDANINNNNNLKEIELNNNNNNNKNNNNDSRDNNDSIEIIEDNKNILKIRKNADILSTPDMINKSYNISDVNINDTNTPKSFYLDTNRKNKETHGFVIETPKNKEINMNNSRTVNVDKNNSKNANTLSKQKVYIDKNKTLSEKDRNKDKNKLDINKIKDLRKINLFQDEIKEEENNQKDTKLKLISDVTEEELNFADNKNIITPLKPYNKSKELLEEISLVNDSSRNKDIIQGDDGIKEIEIEIKIDKNEDNNMNLSLNENINKKNEKEKDKDKDKEKENVKNNPDFTYEITEKKEDKDSEKEKEKEKEIINENIKDNVKINKNLNMNDVKEKEKEKENINSKVDNKSNNIAIIKNDIEEKDAFDNKKLEIQIKENMENKENKDNNMVIKPPKEEIKKITENKIISSDNPKQRTKNKNVGKKSKKTKTDKKKNQIIASIFKKYKAMVDTNKSGEVLKSQNKKSKSSKNKKDKNGEKEIISIKVIINQNLVSRDKNSCKNSKSKNRTEKTENKIIKIYRDNISVQNLSKNKCTTIKKNLTTTLSKNSKTKFDINKKPITNRKNINTTTHTKSSSYHFYTAMNKNMDKNIKNITTSNITYSKPIFGINYNKGKKTVTNSKILNNNKKLLENNMWIKSYNNNNKYKKLFKSTQNKNNNLLYTNKIDKTNLNKKFDEIAHKANKSTKNKKNKVEEKKTPLWKFIQSDQIMNGNNSKEKLAKRNILKNDGNKISSASTYLKNEIKKGGIKIERIKRNSKEKYAQKYSFENRLFDNVYNKKNLNLKFDNNNININKLKNSINITNNKKSQSLSKDKNINVFFINIQNYIDNNKKEKCPKKPANRNYLESSVTNQRYNSPYDIRDLSESVKNKYMNQKTRYTKMPWKIKKKGLDEKIDMDYLYKYYINKNKNPFEKNNKKINKKDYNIKSIKNNQINNKKLESQSLLSLNINKKIKYNLNKLSSNIKQINEKLLKKYENIVTTNKKYDIQKSTNKKYNSNSYTPQYISKSKFFSSFNHLNQRNIYPNKLFNSNISTESKVSKNRDNIKMSSSIFDLCGLFMKEESINDCYQSIIDKLVKKNIYFVQKPNKEIRCFKNGMICEIEILKVGSQNSEANNGKNVYCLKIKSKNGSKINSIFKNIIMEQK